MDLLQPAAPATATTPGPDGDEARARGALSSDLDTFLTLLTAQIRNQDPLNPADSTEFASQLATFSNVEQAVRSNELLSEMVDRLDRQALASAGAWIGMDARHEGAVTLGHAPVRLAADLPEAADRAQLVARDAAGTEVGRLTIPAGTTEFEWSGALDDDGALPPGRYHLSVEAWAGDRPLDRAALSSFARIAEVALEPGGAVLRLETGDVVAMPDLLGLRAPTGP